MSDIGLRLDGLFLAAAIALSALILAVFSLAMLIVAAFSESRRSHLIALAKHAGMQCGISLICLVAVIVYVDLRTAPWPADDWIDWLILPWTILFVFGLMRLVRFRRSSSEAS